MFEAKTQLPKKQNPALPRSSILSFFNIPRLDEA
jgi:hypothetical protein